MRKMAEVKRPGCNARRVILHETEHGVYLFPCSSLEDGSSTGDYWFPDVETADAACRDEYGIEAADWSEIPDPLPGCQQDWTAPVRTKGQHLGAPEWGVLERLDRGEWREITPYRIPDAESP